jgi:glycosyltransferase involved in cell wall biosynthesis
VLYVGKLIHYKGVDNLIRAFQLVLEKCPNCRLTIAGNGDEREELVQLSSELGLEGKVVFAGDVPDQLLAQYYRDSDLLVLPSLESRREAFGMVLLEAMACGIPVIASDIPGPDEVVSNDENGLLTPPGDTAKLAEAMITILSDPRRAEMGGRALRSAKLGYDWSIITGRYEDLYRSSVKQEQINGN